MQTILRVRVVKVYNMWNAYNALFWSKSRRRSQSDMFNWKTLRLCTALLFQQNPDKIWTKLLFSGFPLLDIKYRVAEVAREHGWHPPKSLDLDENFKPEHTLFCRELRYVAIYALFFWRFSAKKVPFWVKTVLLGQEVHYYMVYIAYFTVWKRLLH